MCRSIHTLYNVDSPVTEEEIHAASLQYVRKISGFRRPSKANEAAFLTAVDEVEVITARLLTELATNKIRKVHSSVVHVRNEKESLP